MESVESGVSGNQEIAPTHVRPPSSRTGRGRLQRIVRGVAHHTMFRNMLRYASFGALAFGVVVGARPAFAQFAPQNAVADPANPSLATSTTVSPLGVYTIIDRWYYDCGKKRWVWVSREWRDNGDLIEVPKGGTASPPTTTLPSGPPPGAQPAIGDPNRAFNPTTGQNLARSKDDWIDVKTGKVIAAPKLCPGTASGVAPTPTPKPTQAPIKASNLPLDEDPKYQLITPQPGPSVAPEHGGVYLPPLAGPGSQMFATVVAPNEGGPQDVVVGVVEPNQTRRYYHGKTDTIGRLLFVVPKAAAAIELFRRFGPDGRPDANVQTCRIGGAGAHVPTTTPLPPGKVPPDGPAITEANSAVERGGTQQGTIQLHVRNIDPTHARVLLDGTSDHVSTLAASDSSVVAKVDDQAPLRAYNVSVESDAKRTNVVPTDLVSLVRGPLGPMQVGVAVPVRVQVLGLPPGHAATMHFEIGGAAQLSGGGTTADVPVTDGAATVSVRGVRSGPTVLRYTLRVTIPGYWE